MNRFFNPNSDIWRGFSYAFDVFVLSTCWLLVSSLMLTGGAATTALYYAVNNYLTQKKVNPLKGFAISLKQNFKEAILATLILTIVCLMVVWSMWISYQMMSFGDMLGRVVFFFGLVICIYLVGYIAYVFPTLASYHYRLKELFSMCFKLSIMHLPVTVIFALLYLLVALFAYYFWISLFFMPVIITLIQRHFLNKIYSKHTKSGR